MIYFFKKYEEIIRYLIIGGLTTIVSMILFYIPINTFLDGNIQIELQIANVISWVGSVLFAYITNRKYVFKIKNKSNFLEFSKFLESRLLTLFLDMFVMFIFTSFLLINYNFAKIVSMILVVIFNYILSKVFVFNKK